MTRSVTDHSLFLVAAGVVNTVIALGFGPTYFSATRFAGGLTSSRGARGRGV